MGRPSDPRTMPPTSPLSRIRPLSDTSRAPPACHLDVHGQGCGPVPVNLDVTMKLVLPLVFAAAMTLSTAAFAENPDPATSAGGQTGAKADDSGKPGKSKPSYDPNQTVCKTSQVTGSRLGAHRICHTRAEWDRATREDRSTITNMQSQIL